MAQSDEAHDELRVRNGTRRADCSRHAVLARTRWRVARVWLACAVGFSFWGAQRGLAQVSSWKTVSLNPSGSFALDTSRVEMQADGSYDVWLQTQMARPLLWRTNNAVSQPFNRQLVHLLLRCGPSQYKMVRTIMRFGDGPPIDSSGVGPLAALRIPWSTVDARLAFGQAVDSTCAVVLQSKSSAR